MQSDPPCSVSTYLDRRSFGMSERDFRNSFAKATWTPSKMKTQYFSYVLTLCGDFIYPFTNAIFHILDIFNNYVGLPNQDDHSACLNGMGQLSFIKKTMFSEGLCLIENWYLLTYFPDSLVEHNFMAQFFKCKR